MKVKPNIFQLIRRKGFLHGFATWIECRKHGHDWHSVDSYPHTHTQFTDFQLHEGKIKVVCSRCEAARLVDVRILAYPDGRVAVSSPDGNVYLIP